MSRATPRCSVVRAAGAVLCFAAGALPASGQAPCPGSPFEDVTCFKNGQFCSNPLIYASGRAVCRLEIYRGNSPDPNLATRAGYCTGWLIRTGNRTDIIVTNRHCVDCGFAVPADRREPNDPNNDPNDYDPNYPGTDPAGEPQWGGQQFVFAVAEFNYESAINCWSAALGNCDYWNFAGRTVSRKWRVSRWATDGTCDWAVLKALPDVGAALPGSVYPRLQLGTAAAAKQIQPPLAPPNNFIVGHPKAQAKQVTRGDIDAILPVCDVTHKISTRKGSSGSPVLYFLDPNDRFGNHDPNDPNDPNSPLLNRVRVAGVHWGGGCDGAPGNNIAVQAEVVAGGLAAAVARLDGPLADKCEEAPLIACGGNATVNNTTATEDVNDPAYSCRVGGAGKGFGTLWFRFVPTGVNATIDTEGSAVTDTLLAVYSGNCCGFTEIGCDDDSGTGLLSKVTLAGLTPGQVYYIQAASYSTGNRGNIKVNVACGGIPCDGDVDGDGDVDQDDLDQVLFNFGLSGFPPYTNGDVDGDGDVDQDDLDLILFNFGLIC